MPDKKQKKDYVLKTIIVVFAVVNAFVTMALSASVAHDESPRPPVTRRGTPLLHSRRQVS